MTDPIVQSVSAMFADPVRRRGEQYYRSGKVDLTDGDDDRAYAWVEGTDAYVVAIKYNRAEATLSVSCDCPYVVEHEQPCKHIWATLLAARESTMLGTARSVRRMDLYPNDDWYDGFDDDLADLTGPPLRLVGGHSRTPSMAKPTAASPPSWRGPLTSAARATHGAQVYDFHWPADRQLVYVIDVARTLSGGLLTVELRSRQPKMDGQWSKLKSQPIPRRAIEMLPDPVDRQVLSVMYGGENRSDSYGYYEHRSDNRSAFGLAPALQPTLVRMICESGRAMLLHPPIKVRDRQETLSELSWDDGPPWRFEMRVDRRDNKSPSYAVTGVLHRDGQTMPLSKPAMVTAGGLVITDTVAALLDDGGAFPWMVMLREQSQVGVPVADADAMLETIFSGAAAPPLTLPQELSVERVGGQPVACLRVSKPDRWRGADRLKGEWSFDYDGRLVPWHYPTACVFDASSRRLIERDLAAETAAESQLREVGFKDPPMYLREEKMLELLPKHLPEAVTRLTAAGWRVEAEGKLYRSGGDFQVQLVSGTDWFELRGGATFDDQHIALPELLAAIRRGDTTVTLGDGSVGILPEAWLKKYGLVAGLGKASGDHVRFGRTQVGLLDALLASMPEVDCDAMFERVRDELHGFSGVEACAEPEGFCGELRAYQREGLGWLKFLERFGFGGCLADDMGLGKTVQVLAMLESRAVSGRKGKRKTSRPSLAVVPRSVIYNWMQEAERFTPSLRVLDFSKAGSQDVGQLDQCDLALATYGTLRRDITTLKDVRFDYAILDEAQAIKNANTASAKAARLLQADHRLAMSGTPVENHLGELWSLLEFLNPGMLGSASVFKRFIGSNGDTDSAARELLVRAIRPFVLRRTKSQVAKDLPDRIEQTLYCDMPRRQRKGYDELRDYYRQSLMKKVAKSGLKRSKIHVLEALLRLRQAACHPGLINKDMAAETSAKLDTLLPQLAEVVDEGHKALVFSQFTSMLSIVRQRLDEAGIRYAYLDGRTRDRAARVQQFQDDPDCPVFLISLKAGGVGLNLTAAGYVFLLDPWWNPAVEAQAIDRAHRIGQTRQVFAYRLIARDTVEEKVLQLQQSKRDLADAIINADSSLISDLSAEDLELLLS